MNRTIDPRFFLELGCFAEIIAIRIGEIAYKQWRNYTHWTIVVKNIDVRIKNIKNMFYIR